MRVELPVHELPEPLVDGDDFLGIIHGQHIFSVRIRGIGVESDGRFIFSVVDLRHHYVSQLL